MAQTIASEIQKANDFGTLSYRPILESSFVNRGSEAFGTAMQTLQNIMEALKDVSFRRIGVYGLGGVGKTTLVKEVARRAREEGLFSEVVMVTVSQSFEIKNIQKETAENLGLELQEESMSARANRLQHRPKGQILIILDDIWEKLMLEDAEIYFKDDQSRGNILLVSPNQYALCNDMDVDKVVKVELLSVELYI